MAKAAQQPITACKNQLFLSNLRFGWFCICFNVCDGRVNNNNCILKKINPSIPAATVIVVVVVVLFFSLSLKKRNNTLVHHCT